MSAQEGGVGRDAAVALYEQVKRFVVRRIIDGTWPAGHRLPSEQVLVAQFGISRMTVNRALRELVDQGRIVRVSGIGSFVAADKPQSNLLRIANIANEITARGHAYHCRLIVLERLLASSEVSIGLGLAHMGSVFHSVCLHTEDQVPVQLEERWVNPQLVPAYLDQAFERIPPAEYLMRNVPYDEIEHVVDAVLPTPEQAGLLEMPLQEPCLLLTRRTWTQGKGVTMVRCLHPASRYRLGSRFRPDGNTGVG
ncbi:MAG: histidine utilization repressor [Burkholderiaceae bacterium]